MGQKRSFAVTLGATRDSAFAIANIIIGIEKHSSGLVDCYHVWHDGFSEQDIAALRRIAGDRLELELHIKDDFLRRVGLAEAKSASFAPRSAVFPTASTVSSGKSIRPMRRALVRLT